MWLQNQACSRVGGSGGGLRGIRTSEDDFRGKITSSSLAPTRFYETIKGVYAFSLQFLDSQIITTRETLKEPRIRC